MRFAAIRSRVSSSLRTLIQQRFRQRWLTLLKHLELRLNLERLEDRDVPAIYTVTSTANSGAGSLRQAIIDANANTGLDTINFNIAGSGVQTIALISGLPSITEAVLIDGYSQSGASVNTATNSDNAVLLIQIGGTNAGATANAFTVTGSGTTIRGLVINNFGRSGVIISGSGTTGNTVAGNFIGTTADGLTAAANGNYAVTVASSAANNTIGGFSLADRNILSGNSSIGIMLSGSSSATRVAANFIGIDASGSASLTNNNNGIRIDGSSNNFIGGDDDDDGCNLCPRRCFEQYHRWR
jgi:hypothetical protein